MTVGDAIVDGGITKVQGFQHCTTGLGSEKILGST